MKLNNSGFIKYIPLLILLVCISALIYFGVFKSRNSQVEYLKHPDAVVFYENKKLFRYDFASMKKEEFEGNEEINLGSMFFFNKDRSVFAVLKVPEDYIEKGMVDTGPSKIVFYNRDSLKKISDIDFSLNNFGFTLQISPDGKKFAFVETLGKSIKIYDINGKQVDEYKNDGSREFKVLTWSPNSEKIMYLSNKINPSNSASFDIDYSDSKLEAYNLNSKSNFVITPQDSVSKRNLNDWPGKTIKIDWYSEDSFSFFEPDLLTASQTKWNYSLITNKATKDENFKVGKEVLNKNVSLHSRNNNYILYSESNQKNDETNFKIFNTKENNSIIVKELNISSSLNEESVFWSDEGKYLVVGVTAVCGLVECSKESLESQGVYKVNLDGTNWQKINEIPLPSRIYKGINFWY